MKAHSTVTFGDRMVKSYKVTLSDEVRFLNPRGQHVETPEENLTGKTFEIDHTSRKEKQFGDNTAVTYDIVGLTNGKKPAHITVYFGVAEYAHTF